MVQKPRPKPRRRSNIVGCRSCGASLLNYYVPSEVMSRPAGILPVPQYCPECFNFLDLILIYTPSQGGMIMLRYADEE